MGYSLKPVPFFTDDIAIIPHSATRASLIGKRVSIRLFAGNKPVSLSIRDDNGEYVVETDRDFMVGPLAE